MTGPSGARRGVRAAWLFAGAGAAGSAALGLLIFGCVFLAVAGPRESLALRTRALRSDLATTTPLARSVYATLDYSAFEVVASPVNGPAIAVTRSRLARSLAAEGLPLAPRGSDWSGLASRLNPVTGIVPRRRADGVPPQAEVIYRGKLPGYARLTAGRFPATARARHPGTLFQVAVTRAIAAMFRLKVGSRIGMGNGVTLVVTGIFQPTRSGSGFWTVDPNAAAPQWQLPFNGPGWWNFGVFVGQAELGPLESQLNVNDLGLSWDFPLDLRGLTVGQAGALQASLHRAVLQTGQLSTGIGYLSASGEPATLSSGVMSVLATFLAQDRAVGRVLDLLWVSLAAVAAAVLLLGAFLIAEHRGAELAIMSARGASRWQLAWLVLRPGATVAAAAAVAGAALAVTLTPGESTPLSWWLAGFSLMVAVTGPPAIAAVRRGQSLAPADEPGTGFRLGPVRRLVAETALAAAAVGGLLLLRGVGSDGNLFTELAPALVAIPGALLVMRCYPAVLRMLIRLAGRLRGATAFVGLARAARLAPRATLSAFALVLALSAVGYGTMVQAAVARGDVTTSWQRVGADVQINAAAAATPVTPAVRRGIGSVRGVRHLATVAVSAGLTAAGSQIAVAAVDPRAYAALIAGTPLPAFPAARLAVPAARRAPAGPFPVLASPAAAAVLGTAPVRLRVQGPGWITVRVAGPVAHPSWAPPGAVVVLPLTALGAAPAAPNVLLATGRHIDARRLEAVTQRLLPGAAVTSRSAVLAGLTRTPLISGARLALALGSLAAAALTALVVLIALVLGARSREHTLVRLEVLGLGQRQGRWLVITEVLPQIVVAAVGGIACAAVLVPLIAPAVDLAPLTGSGSPVPFSAQPVPLALMAAGLVTVALLTLGAQTAIAGRRTAARTLRVGE